MPVKNYDGKAVLEAITANVLNTRFEDIDQATVENTKYRLWDMIGCAIGGATLPDMVAVAKMIEDWGGKKEATILGHGIKGPVHDVAFVNCLMGRAFDRGVLVSWGVHSSETTVLSALALGESKGINGKEFITALVVGDDLMSRITRASMGDRPRLGPGLGLRGTDFDFGAGFDVWGTITTMGTAAIAGRLLGLNSFQMKNAFGIAVNLISGATSGLWDGSTTFKLSQGSSARSGILAAKLAQIGWTGILDPFGPKNSYFAVFSREGVNAPEMLTEDLGKKYLVDITLIKMHPGGGPTQTTTDAAIKFATKHDIKADDIEEVILRLSPPTAAVHYMKPYKVGAYPTGDALFSYKYSIANGLVRRTGQNKDYTEEAIRDPRVQTVISKITLEDMDKPEGIEIEVKLKDGRKMTEYYVRKPSGGPGTLPSRDAMMDKFMEQVEFSHLVDKKNAEEVVKLVEGLEEVDNVAEIVKLAVKSK